MKSWTALLGLTVGVSLMLSACDPAPEPTPAKPEPKPAPEVKKPDAPKIDPASNPSRVFQVKDLQVAKMDVNGHSLDLWVMDTDQKREEGMMFLTDAEVKKNEGMVFVFKQEEPATASFWMKNTLIPLDIIYIDASKHIVGIKAGKPLDIETKLSPGKKYQYVVELKQGQASEIGLKDGATVPIPASVVAQD